MVLVNNPDEGVFAKYPRGDATEMPCGPSEPMTLLTPVAAAGSDPTDAPWDGRSVLFVSRMTVLRVKDIVWLHIRFGLWILVTDMTIPASERNGLPCHISEQTRWQMAGSGPPRHEVCTAAQ